MVKIRNTTKYDCEVCGKSYWYKTDAEKCESRQAIRIELAIDDQHRDYCWKENDFILLFPSTTNPCFKRTVPRLAKIVGQTTVKHDIVPVLQFVESKSYNYPGYRDTETYSKYCWGSVVPFNNEIKDMLEGWLEGLNEY